MISSLRIEKLYILDFELFEFIVRKNVFLHDTNPLSPGLREWVP